MDMHDSDLYVKHLQLRPHPEGGYFREVYRSQEIISKKALPNRFGGDRHFSTSIYFLLESGQFSALHRIRSDEIWHFYAGSSLHVHTIHTNGRYELIKLGQDLEGGENLQAMVPAGAWFGARVPGDGFALCGCTVAPGFDFADFEMARQNELLELYPQHQELILTLTHHRW